MGRDQKLMVKKEKSSTPKAVSFSEVKFDVEGDDVKFTTGPYSGKTVKQIFESGPDERDYIMKNVYSTNNSAAMKIIRSMACK